MGVSAIERGPLLRALMTVSHQMLFFTAGEKAVGSRMLAQGATTAEAAGSIHTDLARGFVRAERVSCEDLFRVGSEREIKAQNLMSKEPLAYVLQEGDILDVLSSA